MSTRERTTPLGDKVVTRRFYEGREDVPVLVREDIILSVEDETAHALAIARSRRDRSKVWP